MRLAVCTESSSVYNIFLVMKPEKKMWATCHKGLLFLVCYEPSVTPDNVKFELSLWFTLVYQW